MFEQATTAMSCVWFYRRMSMRGQVTQQLLAWEKTRYCRYKRTPPFTFSTLAKIGDNLFHQPQPMPSPSPYYCTDSQRDSGWDETSSGFVSPPIMTLDVISKGLEHKHSVTLVSYMVSRRRSNARNFSSVMAIASVHRDTHTRVSLGTLDTRVSLGTLTPQCP